MRVGIVILPEDRWWAAEPKWRAAEEYGFDHAWTYDHLGWRSLVDGPWFSAVPTLAAAAMVTSTIRLGTFVASPNFRHPVPFARELITLEDLADGRIVLGVGAGGEGYDAEVLGEPALSPKERADRFVEFVDALDGLLREDGFDHEGRRYRAVGARNLPGPVQRPRPPLLLAADGPRTIRYAASTGDGWITTGDYEEGQSLEDWWRRVTELVGRFDDAVEKAGRDRSLLATCLNLDVGPVYSLSSRDAFSDAVGRAEELGFSDVVVHWPRGGEPYQGQESVLEDVAADLLPAVQGREAPASPGGGDDIAGDSDPTDEGEPGA